MASRYWFRICPVCQEGRLFIVKLDDEQVLYFHCEECECAWGNPENVVRDANVLAVEHRCSPATRQDIEHAGWQPYALHHSS